MVLHQDGTPLTRVTCGHSKEVSISCLSVSNLMKKCCAYGSFGTLPLPDSWETFRMSLSNSALDGLIFRALGPRAVF